jgi:UDP-N-acetyl-D-mannosaminuronate dehydrogenase
MLAHRRFELRTQKFIEAICMIWKVSREQIARYSESDTPVAVTRRGETLAVYVPTPRKSVNSADLAELRAAAEQVTRFR